MQHLQPSVSCVGEIIKNIVAINNIFIAYN